MCREVPNITTAIGIALRPSVDIHYTCVSNQMQAAVDMSSCTAGDYVILESCLLCSKITELSD
jgi:hypothetical protein